MGYRVGYRRGFGCWAISCALGAPLPLASNIPFARADAAATDGVVLACPDLLPEKTAELEARARATLLTSDLSATVTITCMAERVAVQVDAGDDSVTLKLRLAATTLREDVLRALDRALAELSARVTPEDQAAASAPAPSTGTGSGVSQLEPVAAETQSPSPARQPTPAARLPASELEVGAQVIGESWGKKPALGGGLRAAVRFDSTWSCGVRAGAFHPLGLREATALEAHAVLDVAVTARSLAGLRFTLGAGPSLLLASPEAGFVGPGAPLKSALRVEAQIGRPFRWHWVELTPWVGARAFTAERGVRVAEQSRLVLGGVQPQFGLALSLIH
ncbi:MAG: hypothetical protein K0R38_3921 [Polyangiaceae bacterium]|nr:hypothetical protein [Polyangiaceae bacterium]